MQVHFSDSAEPGAASQKIMQHIRFSRTLAEYQANTRHVIYGKVGPRFHLPISLRVHLVDVIPSQ
jgi:5'-3' exonuclease